MHFSFKKIPNTELYGKTVERFLGCYTRKNGRTNNVKLIGDALKWPRTNLRKTVSSQNMDNVQLVWSPHVIKIKREFSKDLNMFILQVRHSLCLMFF
jgi:hypothetical protein